MYSFILILDDGNNNNYRLAICTAAPSSDATVEKALQVAMFCAKRDTGFTVSAALYLPGDWTLEELDALEIPPKAVQFHLYVNDKEVFK